MYVSCMTFRVGWWNSSILISYVCVYVCALFTFLPFKCHFFCVCSNVVSSSVCMVVIIVIVIVCIRHLLFLCYSREYVADTFNLGMMHEREELNQTKNCRNLIGMDLNHRRMSIGARVHLTLAFWRFISYYRDFSFFCCVLSNKVSIVLIGKSFWSFVIRKSVRYGVYPYFFFCLVEALVFWFIWFWL